MILQDAVFIVLNGSNILYYERLGYKIPYYFDKHHNKKSVKQNTKIKVNVCHLQKSSNVKVICQCDICGKQRLLKFNKYNSSNDICKSCSSKTNERNKKLSISKTGNKNAFFGKKHSKETLEKLKNAKLGSKNPNFNSKLTDEERKIKRNISGIKKWRFEIIKKNNYTCQKCNSNEKLCAHHINNFSNFKEQRTNIENGITLCENCHKNFHKKYKIPNDINQLKEFLKN